MAKIGVVTFAHTTDNYGQVLQFLATKCFLENAGHTANLILLQDCLYKRVCNRLKRTFFKNEDSPQNLSEEDIAKEKIFKQWAAVSVRNENEHPRMFDQFRQKYFDIDKGTRRRILSHGYNAFCVGSDQTWSNASDLFLLKWVPSNYLKFSLAPSVGHKVFGDEEIEAYKKALSEFSYITVREDNGLELCQKANHPEVEKILDPTFLVDSAAYNKYADTVEKKKTTIFIYMLGGEISYSIREMIKYYEEKGYVIKYVESQGRDEQIGSLHATVGEWLGLMSSADYVITNSFHGMAFSIIYRKPFMVFPLCGIMKGMNGRIQNLCDSMKFNDRIFTGSLDTLFNPIDWTTAESCIQNNRNKVLDKINYLFA